LGSQNVLEVNEPVLILKPDDGPVALSCKLYGDYVADKIPVFKNLKVNYHVYKLQPLDPVITNFNPVFTPSYCLPVGVVSGLCFVAGHFMSQ